LSSLSYTKVFLYIYGTENNWTSINLQKTSKSIDGFPSGSTRTFCIQGPNIGQLHHLNVNVIQCTGKYLYSRFHCLARRFSIE